MGSTAPARITSRDRRHGNRVGVGSRPGRWRRSGRWRRRRPRRNLVARSRTRHHRRPGIGIVGCRRVRRFATDRGPRIGVALAGCDRGTAWRCRAFPGRGAARWLAHGAAARCRRLGPRRGRRRRRHPARGRRRCRLRRWRGGNGLHGRGRRWRLGSRRWGWLRCRRRWQLDVRHGCGRRCRCRVAHGGLRRPLLGAPPVRAGGSQHAEEAQRRDDPAGAGLAALPAFVPFTASAPIGRIARRSMQWRRVGIDPQVVQRRHRRRPARVERTEGGAGSRFGTQPGRAVRTDEGAIAVAVAALGTGGRHRPRGWGTTPDCAPTVPAGCRRAASLHGLMSVGRRWSPRWRTLAAEVRSPMPSDGAQTKTRRSGSSS